MYFLFIVFLLTAGYSVLFYFFVNSNPYFLFLWIPVSFIIAFITFALYLYCYLLIASHTKPNKRHKHFLLRNTVFIALLVFHIKITVIGKENIPNETFIVYSNHKSNMDPMFIYYALHTKSITAIGKSTLFKNHFMKLIGNTFGAIPLNRENDREAAKAIIRAIGDVKKGMSMIIFPEGGIKTRDVEEMVNLRAGAYKLATKSGAKILPCAIVGSSQIKKKRRISRKNVTVIFYKPIDKEEYSSMNTTEIGLMVEDIINNGIKNYGQDEQK